MISIKHLYCWFTATCCIFFFNAQSISQSDTLKEYLVLEKMLTKGAETFSVVEIDSLDIIKYRGQTIDDLLSRNGAVFIKQYGSGNLATLSIRGSSANQTQVFWNDIPVNAATLGLTDLSLLPVDFYDKIVLQKGGSSLSSGSGGIGGALSLYSNQTNKDKFKLSAEQTLGSFGIKRTKFKINYGNELVSLMSGYIHRFAINDFDYLDITAPNVEEKDRENASINQHGFFQEGKIKLKANSAIDFKLNFFKSWRQIPTIIGLPDNGEFQNDQQFRSLIGYNWFNDKWSHQLKIAYVNEYMSYQDTANDIASEFNVNAYHANYKINRYFSKIKAKVQLYLMNRMDVADSDYFSENTSQKRSSSYIKWEHELGKTIYHVAVRHELIDMHSKPIMPSLGFKRAFNSNQKEILSDFNISKTSRYPTLNDQFWIPGGNTALFPEIGYELEWNNSVDLLEGINFSISTFYGRTNDWIIWLPNSNSIWTPQNIKKIERYGIESRLVFNKQLGSLNLKSTFQYNYLHAGTISSYVENDASIGNQLMYVPKSQGQFCMDIIYKKFLVYYRQSIVGKVFINNDNSSYLPYYAPADLGIEWTSRYIEGKQIVTGIKINNIFNEDYHVISYRPMPGIHVLFNLKINLKQS